MPGKSNNLAQFWQELKRRKVVRVITVYAAACFVILELVSIIAEPLRLPDWTLALVIVLLCIGFIITVILSWVYDITPEGIEKTKPVKEIQKSNKPTVSIVWKIATYISISLILAFVVFNLLNNKNPSESQTEIGKSIAVLPFVDMSPQKDQEYFCDGITEELINSLTQVEGLKVIARTSTFAFKGKHEDIREIGSKLDVETLLEGSVQKAGDRLRITAQLIKVEDGVQLWSQQYDRDLEDVFAIQDEISMAITEILKAKLLGDKKNSISERQTDNIEAYNLYLRGRFFWNHRTKEDVKRSIFYYNQAIKHDSTYALAYAGLADTYFVLAWWEWYPKHEGYNKGREYARKALSINDNIAEAHATLGGIAAWYDWKWEESINEFQQAISLNPNHATAYQYYSETLDVLGRNKEAREQINIALKLNPHSPVMYSLSAMYYYNTADYEKAIEESRKALEIIHYNNPKIRIIKCYLELGMNNNVLEYIKDIVSFDTTGNDHEILDELYQNSGIEGIVPWFINWMLLNESNGNFSIHSFNYRIASLYAVIEDSQKAIEYLEKGMEIGEGSMPRIKNNPDFDIIRDDPRFKALLKEMRLL
jgi:TolB-like protein